MLDVFSALACALREKLCMLGRGVIAPPGATSEATGGAMLSLGGEAAGVAADEGCGATLGVSGDVAGVAAGGSTGGVMEGAAGAAVEGAVEGAAVGGAAAGWATGWATGGFFLRLVSGRGKMTGATPDSFALARVSTPIKCKNIIKSTNSDPNKTRMLRPWSVHTP